MRRDRDRRALGGGRAGDPLAGPHPRPPRHLVDARAVRRPQDELVGVLVVEVDEARVGAERLLDLLATSPSTSSRSSVELTAAIVSVSSRR